MNKKRRTIFLCLLLAVLAAVAVGIVICRLERPHVEEKYEKADLSGYTALAGEDTVFRDMSIQDLVWELDAGSTFVVVFSHSKCPWCNAVLPVLNEIGTEEAIPIGYVNTREKPEWRSNVSMEDYDLLVQVLGEYFPLDDLERPHLYVPHVFFIRKGEVVFEYAGAVPDYDGSGDPLTVEQAGLLMGIYREGFDLLRS